MLPSDVAYRRVDVTTFLDNGAVYLGPHSGRKALRLEGTGRRIWELLEYPIGLDDLCARLCAEYEADSREVTADLRQTVDGLMARGLIEAVAVPTAADEHRNRYLWLLKRALTNLIYPELEMRIRLLQKVEPLADRLEQSRLMRDIRYRHQEQYDALAESKQDGHVSNPFAHTLVGLLRLENLERCAERIFIEHIPGDFLEAGVWQGGAAIFLRALLVAHHQPERVLWAADSFRGCPPPRMAQDKDANVDFTEETNPWCAISVEAVRDNFERYGLYDDRVRFLVGWFSETLPSAPIDQVALLRLDGDMYESTWDTLVSLYDKVSPGGFVIVDDYHVHDACRAAVNDFRNARDIHDSLRRIDWNAAYWRKSA